MSMDSLLRFVVARLKEGSTYAGLALVLTGFGMHLKPEMREAIAAIGTMVAGLIAAAFPNEFGSNQKPKAGETDQ